jgi:hypothetical protein
MSSHLAPEACQSSRNTRRRQVILYLSSYQGREKARKRAYCVTKA